jgi:hypothetical protein
MRAQKLMCENIRKSIKSQQSFDFILYSAKPNKPNPRGSQGLVLNGSFEPTTEYFSLK